MKKKLKTSLALLGASIFLLTGCSSKNPFGIGYEHSVCEGQTKEFGMCGSPKSIFKYESKIKEVQKEYFESGLKKKLYFAVDRDGNILVKDTRDGKWQFYETSKWKKIIENLVHKKKEKMERLKTKEAASVTSVQYRYINNKINLSALPQDVPVTKADDLSVKYQEQGPLVVTRTKIGNLIRDMGLIQPVFVSNYVDKDGDLVSAHEIYVVVKEPSWVIGEKTPKYVPSDTYPTPLSKKIIKKGVAHEQYQEDVIKDYNLNYKKGIINAVKNNPQIKEQENQNNLDIINQFLKEK
jgi:hypothetical protein